MAQSGSRLSQRHLPDSPTAVRLPPRYQSAAWRGSVEITRSAEWVDTAWFETALGWSDPEPVLPLLAQSLGACEATIGTAHPITVVPTHHTRRLRPRTVYADQWSARAPTHDFEATSFSQMYRFALYSRLLPRTVTVQSEAQDVFSFVFFPPTPSEPKPGAGEGHPEPISLHTPVPATDAQLEIRPTPVGYMISGRCSAAAIYAVNCWGNLNGNSLATTIAGVKTLTTSGAAERQANSAAASSLMTLARTLPGVPGWVSWAVQSLTVAGVVFDTTGRLEMKHFAFERRELAEPSNQNVNPNPESVRDTTRGRDHWFVALHRSANLETRISTPYGRSDGSRHAGGAIYGTAPGDLFARPEHYGRSTLYFFQRTAQRVTATLSSL